MPGGRVDRSEFRCAGREREEKGERRSRASGQQLGTLTVAGVIQMRRGRARCSDGGNCDVRLGRSSSVSTQRDEGDSPAGQNRPLTIAMSAISQDFVEDQFGLGLIAWAVEEGIAIIKPMGIMIFNVDYASISSGKQTLCSIILVFGQEFRVAQQHLASDADISALVEIEKIYPHHFEFFMDLHGDQPVSACTALAYMKSGGRVSHAFSVYSCQLRQPNQVKKLFESFKNGLHEVSSSLDLSFDDDSVADEKIPFLVYLAHFLKDDKPNPCEPPAGCLNFRNIVAEFMKSYHHIPLTPEDVVVFPSRDVAIENYLRLFSPSLAIVDEHLTRHLPKQWLTSSAIEWKIHAYPVKKNDGSRMLMLLLPFDTAGEGRCNRAEDTVTVIEAPCRSDLLIELVRKLKPQVVVTGIAHFEVVTSAAFVNLLSATQDVGSRLFLDISEHLELSNLPNSNGVLKYLAGNTLPSHAAILCGLVKNQVYSDLEVAFAISEDAAVCKALSQTIEILEGHTSVISQHYYGCLLHELLAFQIGDQHAQQERQPAEVTPQKIIGFSNSALTTLEEAEFFVPELKDCSVIHMDLDRSFLSVPSAVKASIFESFVRQNITDSEADVRSSIEKLVGNNYGLPGDDCPDIAESSYRKEIVYGSSCLALFNKLIICCVQEQGTFFFPMGTNGHYVAAAKFMNAKTLTIPTNVESGFKIEPMALDAALEDAIENNNVFRPWVYISGPTINPSGFLYSDNEIKDLVSVCAHRSARVVIDTSFSGLEFQTDGWSRWNLSTLSYDICLCSTLTYFMLGELSLQLTASGLDFGFLICSKPPNVELSFGSLSQPHKTLKYAFRKLLGLKNEWDGHFSSPFYSLIMEQQDKAQEWFEQVQKADKGKFSNIIMEQREKLKKRANKLTKVDILSHSFKEDFGFDMVSFFCCNLQTLESCGWDVVGGDGGTSMLAKPTAYISRSFKIDGFEGELDGCNIREAVLRSTGLCISSSKWTGIPDYCRFSFALESSEFERAMDCIIRFRELVLGEEQGSI
ncbi:hypothetical protein CFC21_068166 [Triticum aestivum]|uniref:Aminotransferase class I/classII large domain-containing protein n=3 Tax=Triticum TaxID=4564 RepID=A0A9R1H9V9_WHEAT|nr:hypothetical protein CFC21_068166 [Triticum aestivum]